MWAAGKLAEVGWTVMANHGGGYAYRLAPADGRPLTEAEFRKIPLDFEGHSALRWDGLEGTRRMATACESGRLGQAMFWLAAHSAKPSGT